jgi:hypothetical protein
MKTILKMIFLLASVLLLLGACQQEAVNPQENTENAVATEQPFVLTQELLDGATLLRDASDTTITGAPFGNRNNDPAQFFIRDIFSNVPPNQPLRVGSVIVIRAFENRGGRRGQLQFVDVMVKHEPGFNPVGRDFEYIRILTDARTDFVRHPNGLLPAATQRELRGTDLNVSPMSCVSCHRADAADFVFHRNFQ